jgi:hypothetical protein
MNDNIFNLVKYVVEQFAEKKDEIVYDVQETPTAIEINISLAEEDMGKVIGKQGKIAKALRTLVKAQTPRDSKKYVVEIKEKA